MCDGLLIAGFSREDLIKAGFNVDNITLQIDKDKLATIEASRYNLDYLVRTFNVEQLRGFGISAKELIELKGLKDFKINVTILKAAGFTINELKAAGFTVQQLKAVGFTIKELIKGQFTNKELKEGGFNRFDIGITIDAYQRL